MSNAAIHFSLLIHPCIPLVYGSLAASRFPLLLEHVDERFSLMSTSPSAGRQFCFFAGGSTACTVGKVATARATRGHRVMIVATVEERSIVRYYERYVCT